MEEDHGVGGAWGEMEWEGEGKAKHRRMTSSVWDFENVDKSICIRFSSLFLFSLIFLKIASQCILFIVGEF